MRISGLSGKDAAALVDASLAAEIDFFDHADIYGGGKSEEVFGAVVHSRHGYLQCQKKRSNYDKYIYDDIIWCASSPR